MHEEPAVALQFGAPSIEVWTTPLFISAMQRRSSAIVDNTSSNSGARAVRRLIVRAMT